MCTVTNKYHDIALEVNGTYVDLEACDKSSWVIKTATKKCFIDFNFNFNFTLRI